MGEEMSVTIRMTFPKFLFMCLQPQYISVTHGCSVHYRISTLLKVIPFYFCKLKPFYASALPIYTNRFRTKDRIECAGKFLDFFYQLSCTVVASVLTVCLCLNFGIVGCQSPVTLARPRDYSMKLRGVGRFTCVTLDGDSRASRCSIVCKIQEWLFHISLQKKSVKVMSRRMLRHTVSLPCSAPTSIIISV